MAGLERKALLRHLVSLALGLGLLGAFVGLGGLQSLRRLGHLAPIPTLLALVVTVVLTWTISARWSLLVTALTGARAARLHHYFHYTLVSRVLGYVIPKDVSDLASRLAAIHKFHGVAVSPAAGSIVLDRLFDFVLAGTMLVAVLPFWVLGAPEDVGLATMGGVWVLGGGLLLGFHRELLRLPLWMLNRLSILLARFRKRPKAPDTLSPDLVDRRTALWCYVLSGIKFAFASIRMYLFSEALGLDLPVLLIVLATPIGQLSYALAFTPGGLGIFEAGWVGALRWAGIELETAVSLAVGQRVLTLSMIVMLTGVSQILYTAWPPRKAQPQS